MENQKEQIRQLVFEVFWEVYKQEELSKIKVSKICQLAQISRATFYKYFEGIHDLLDQWEQTIIDGKNFQNRIMNNLVSFTMDEAILKSVIELYAEREEYFSVLLGANGDQCFRNKLLKTITPIILNTVRATGRKEIHLEYIMEYQNAGIISVVSRWFENGKPISEKELISLLSDITNNGVKQELIKEKVR